MEKIKNQEKKNFCVTMFFLFLVITFANFFKGEKMLAVPLIVHHKTDPKLRAGIVVDQTIVNASSPLNPQQVVPVVLCSVVWDEGSIDEASGEVIVPADKDRLDAICLHQASELVFDGPYVQTDGYENEEEEDEEEIAEGDETPEAQVAQS
jgi:hypothetical protein